MTVVSGDALRASADLNDIGVVLVSIGGDGRTPRQGPRQLDLRTAERGGHHHGGRTAEDARSHGREAPERRRRGLCAAEHAGAAQARPLSPRFVRRRGFLSG